MGANDYVFCMLLFSLYNSRIFRLNKANSDIEVFKIRNFGNYVFRQLRNKQCM